MAKALALLLLADFTDLSSSVTYAGAKQSIGSDYSPTLEQLPVKLSCKNKALNNLNPNKSLARSQPRKGPRGACHFGAWKW